MAMSDDEAWKSVVQSPMSFPTPRTTKVELMVPDPGVASLGIMRPPTSPGVINVAPTRQAHIVGVINATVVRFPSGFQFSVVRLSVTHVVTDTTKYESRAVGSRPWSGFARHYATSTSRGVINVAPTRPSPHRRGH